VPQPFSQRRARTPEHEVREPRERIDAALRLLTNAPMDGSGFSAIEAMEAAVVLLGQADDHRGRAS